MAMTFGKVYEYNHENEEWRHYVERLDHFFMANEISSSRRALERHFFSTWFFLFPRVFEIPQFCVENSSI